MAKHVVHDVEVKKNLALRAFFFVAGFACALFVILITSYMQDGRCHRTVTSSVYKNIASSAPCYMEDVISFHYDPGLKSDVQDYIDQPRVRKVTKHVSVYYYNLKNGTWFGINENEKFYPASLLKLPIAMSVMKQLEDSPQFLSQEIRYTGTDAGYSQHYPPSERLESGKTYTVGQLVEKALKFSNNEAAFTLYDILGEKEILSVYRDIGLPLPTTIGAKFITVQQYGYFYKSLFNAQYLSHRSSESLLELLTKTYFKEGLVAGVPEGIRVAHKFGERVDENDSTYKYQLHDCGIIYEPDNPYILCVMTRGDDFAGLSGVLENVSRVVYDSFSKK